MIRIQANEPDDPKWKKWRKQAEDACRALIIAVGAGSEPEISDSLYKAQKQTIWCLFHGKCAYCEVRLTGNQPGDVEHYRPKKGLVDDDLKPIVDPDTHKKHLGYYWLAYDWRNLLPSCIECNRPSVSLKGERLGKRTLFPVDGFRAFKPGDEGREHPLLLNPWDDDPEEHLLFDETGIVGSRTARGQKTIEVLGLNRDGLLEERRNAVSTVKGLLVRLVNALIEGNSGSTQSLKGELEEYKTGKKPYSAVARAALVKKCEELRRI